MLRGFLLAAGISVAVFGLCIGVFFLLDWWGVDNEVLLGILYYTCFYLAPLGFVVGVIGSIVAAVRYAVAGRASI
jgi:hypothetical protein